MFEYFIIGGLLIICAEQCLKIRSLLAINDNLTKVNAEHTEKIDSLVREVMFYGEFVLEDERDDIQPMQDIPLYTMEEE